MLKGEGVNRKDNMIIDLNAFIGTWPSHPVEGELDTVRNSLRSYGVERIFVSHLESAWCQNPHLFNDRLYRSVEDYDDVFPVPVIAPTIATWRNELACAVQQPKVKLVRLLPGYSLYNLSEIDDFLTALTKLKLGVIVQTRLEDPRRQHPLAQAPDVSAMVVADAAERHPDLTVIIGGPRAAEIKALKERLLKIRHLYADISQADGLDVVKVLVADGLRDKLLFGSHAPLFIPHAALSRVITDIDNETAAAILGGNAIKMLSSIRDNSDLCGK